MNKKKKNEKKRFCPFIFDTRSFMIYEKNKKKNTQGNLLKRCKIILKKKKKKKIISSFYLWYKVVLH